MARRRFNIQQHVKDQIVVQIEAGAPLQRRPWTGARTAASFLLRHSGERYKRVNLLLLWDTAPGKVYTIRPMDDLHPSKDLGA